MIGNQEGLAEDRVVLVLADRFEQVSRGVGDQVHDRLEVRAERSEGLVPGLRVGWCITRWPVAGGPLGGDVLGVDAVAENIPLGDSHVLEQAPGGVRLAGGLFAAKLGG